MNITVLKKRVKDSKFYKKTIRIQAELTAKHRMRGRYSFIDRSHKSDTLCIILAGYKEFLYPAVFGRIKKYAPSDMDICVLTSGLYSETVDAYCKNYGWSYLRTYSNNVCLIQNKAIQMHPKAKYIFKLDEDMFIADGYFKNMLRAYSHAEMGDYKPGVLAPLIPINGYGNMRILRKLNLVDIYTKKYGTPKYFRSDDASIEANPEVAKFFWGEGGIVPSIDEMNRRFSLEALEERPCAIQFSIGAVLFTREFWQAMNMFPVSKIRNLGMDERHLCRFCCEASRPLLVSENVLVGHLAFQKQNAAMKDFFLAHQNLFLS